MRKAAKARKHKHNIPTGRYVRCMHARMTKEAKQGTKDNRNRMHGSRERKGRAYSWIERQKKRENASRDADRSTLFFCFAPLSLWLKRVVVYYYHYLHVSVSFSAGRSSSVCCKRPLCRGPSIILIGCGWNGSGGRTGGEEMPRGEQVEVKDRKKPPFECRVCFQHFSGSAY